MGITSQWYQGIQYGRDGWFRHPFSAAHQARKVCGDFTHFAPGLLTSSTTYPGYAVTVLTAGTLVMADAAAGWLNLTGSAADGQGIQMQSDGEIFLPAANKDIFFQANIKIADADDADWFLGLASTDTDIFSTDPTEIIAFRGDDGDANIDFQVRDGGTGAQADTTEDAADATAVRLGFWVKGITSVTPYINGVAGTPVTANIPTALMSITFGMLNGATLINNTVGIDYYGVSQPV